MFKNLRRIAATIGASLALALIPVAVPAAYAATDNPDINGNLACGSNLSVQTNNCTGDLSTGTDQIQRIVTMVINIFSVVVGIVAVIMIIYGGFKYITSGGDSGNITSAKNTIVYAIIGLVVVALAQFIVKFVLDKVISS